LSITLNINQNEYIAEAGDTAGAVVVIRPQNEMPFPEDDGIIVSPGHATSISITQVPADINTPAIHYRRETTNPFSRIPDFCVLNTLMQPKLAV